MREIDSIRYEIAWQRKSIQYAAARLVELQKACKHTWGLHSQRLKNQESGKYWIHRVCTTCDLAETKLENVPICPECYVPLVAVVFNGAAEEVKKLALAEDEYATIAFAFACAQCGCLHGFAFRDKQKK